MAVKKKIKATGFIVLGIIIVVLIAVFFVVKHFKYIQSDKYLLLEKGYSDNEIEVILKDKNMINTLLKRDYNKYIVEIMNEKYYIEKNLNSYLKYKEENEDKSNKDIIAITNVGADKEWYSDIKPTDLSKGYLILVNKFNQLDEDYELEDLVTMSVQYAFNGKLIRKDVDTAFGTMAAEARGSGLKIVANSTYRDYKYQDSIYRSNKNNKGQIYADNYVARPGHSEHQTGLSIDISTLNTTEDFELTDEFTWLLNNAYKYGFILRYPKDKEYITGYNYESWHYRYVGVEVATKIKEENITFDEYYAYYVK